MICIVKSDVDPLDLRINNRYLDVRKVPPNITKAYKKLVSDAQKAGEEQGWLGRLNPKARIKMTFHYTWSHNRADVDGPSKRAQDAIAAGLGFNDNRVDVVTHIRTAIGDPSIQCVVETLDHHDPIPVDDEEGWSIGVGETSPQFHARKV